MSTPQPQIKIAIAGGGIAGLALAAGIHKKHKHLDFHVYEATNVYKDVGAGLAIHLNGIKAMDLVTPELKQAYFDKGLLMGEEDQEMGTEVIMAQGGFAGELIVALGRAKGRKTVSRADLLEGFAALIPRDRITFGKRLEKIEQDHGGVQLTFQDGSKAEADILIAADGVHSVARRYILGADHPATEPVNHENWRIYNNTMPMEIAQQHIPERWTRGIPILLGPGAYVNSMPLSKGTRLSANLVFRGWKADESSSLSEQISEHFKDYNEDARSIASLISENPTSWEPHDHDHAPTYFRGNVAMIGDAAHATMAFNGQGAAQALEDVSVLDALLPHFTSLSHIPSLFSAYDTTRRPRSQRVVEISRKFGRIYGYAEGDLHEDPAEIRKVMGRDGAFTNGADLGKQNEEAVRVFLEGVRSGRGGEW